MPNFGEIGKYLEEAVGKVKPAVEKPQAPPSLDIEPTRLGPTQPGRVEPVLAKEVYKVPEPTTPGQFQPTTRVQQSNPANRAAWLKVEGSPEYQQHLMALGGGRVVPRAETFAKTLDMPDMTPEELMNWPQGKPASATDIARAMNLQSYLFDQHLDALQRRDWDTAGKIDAVSKKTLAGYNVLTGEFGRGLDLQKVILHSKEISGIIEQGRQEGITQEQLAARINGYMQRATRDRDIKEAVTPLTNWWDRLVNYSVGAKLTSLTTHLWNTAGNAAAWMQRGMEKTVEAGVLAGQGDEAGAKAAFQFAWGTTEGATMAMHKALQELVSEVPQRVRDNANVPVKGGKPLPLPLRLMSPFRWLGAADEFWKTLYYEGVKNELAHAQAMREGLQGEALGNRIAELVQNPPDYIHDFANSVKLEYTYQDDPGAVAQYLTQLRSYVPFGRFVAPFISTPANILRFQLRRSPVGLLPVYDREVGWKMSHMMEGLTGNSTERARALGQLSVGTLMTLAAWSLYEQGHVTGPYPTDPHEKDMWKAKHIRPYSIQIGGRYWQYNRIQPIGMYLSEIATARQLFDQGDHEKAQAKIAASIIGAATAFGDMPWLSGMQDMFAAMKDPSQYADKFVSGIATGFIPNVVKDIRYQMDPTIRSPRGMEEAIENSLPGMSQKVPAQVDILGDVATMDSNRILRALKITSETATGPKEAVIKALEDTGTELSSVKPLIEIKDKNGGIEKVELKGAEATRFMQEMGKATLEAISEVTSSDRYKSLPLEGKQTLLLRVVQNYRGRVRNLWRRDILRQRLQTHKVKVSISE